MKFAKLFSMLLVYMLLSAMSFQCRAALKAPAEIQPINAPFPMPEMHRPVFQDKQFNILDYDAQPGGEIKNTDAIAKAINACSKAGGGSVVVPAGQWLTGSVHLKSNVNLHILEGGELVFSDDPADYLPVVHTTWEGMECMNYSPLIYAFECENIAITGKGKLTCNQYKWRRWMNRPPAHMQGLKELYEMAAKNVPVKERNMVRDDIHLRPQFIQPNRCKNVLIEDVTIRNSPFWTVHPVLCENVIIRGIDVKCRGRNTDGVDPEFCKNVLIEYCQFDQGDDPIVIKAGRNQDAWRTGKCSENIVIRYCNVILGHNLLAIGSEMSGGVRNVYMHDCNYTPYEGFVRSCVLIKTNHRRGGFVENIYVDNIRFHGSKPAKALLEIDTDVLYQWRDLVPTYETRLTKIGNIRIENVTAGEMEYGLWIRGEKDRPVRDIALKNVKVSKVTKKIKEVKNAENITETNVRFGDTNPASAVTLKFDFGSNDADEGYTPVTPKDIYSAETGFGFLPGTNISSDAFKNNNSPLIDFCTSDKPIMFSTDVPEEGNYRVTVTLGGNKPANMYVKAESRRLMLENVKIAANESKKLTFIVNIRSSRISEGRSVKLKPREKEPTCYHWDNSLTLEFNGENPSVSAVEIEKADNLPTVFLCGDSTVNDQTLEPWTSWGQMLTRFFKPEVAIANYAESGETLRAFKGERRLEKIETQIKPGDYMFIQFAHNDMKRGTPEEIGYQKSLTEFMDVARKHKANPVLVTSMHRRRFDDSGKVIDTMSGFPEAMKQLAKDQGVPLIDLHAMSRKFYEAMGPEPSARAFVDGTHHNAYGAYELARCIVEGIKNEVPQLAIFLVDDLTDFDPANPDPVDDFFMPASLATSEIKPEGS